MLMLPLANNLLAIICRGKHQENQKFYMKFPVCIQLNMKMDFILSLNFLFTDIIKMCILKYFLNTLIQLANLMIYIFNP